MADEKRYFSVKDMFEQAVTRAKTDPRYEEYSKICELDYDLLCSTCKYDKLYRCEFDVVGEVTYGSSEGIYGDIFLYGNWSKERDDPFKSRARVYVLKTLKQDKESYLAVGMKEKNKKEFFGTRDEAISNGYSPCGRCRP